MISILSIRDILNLKTIFFKQSSCKFRSNHFISGWIYSIYCNKFPGEFYNFRGQHDYNVLINVTSLAYMKYTIRLIKRKPNTAKIFCHKLFLNLPITFLLFKIKNIPNAIKGTAKIEEA